MASRARNTLADVEGRKKLFRATAGLSLQQQLQVASHLQSTGNDVLQKIQQMKKTSKQQKQATKENNLKYEWLHEHQHLKKLEEACTKELESLLLRLYNDACQDKATLASCSSSSSVLKPKSSPRPEAESPAKRGDDHVGAQYSKELEELLGIEQSHRIALLKHVASEREQHQSMKQLLTGLQQRLRQPSSGSAAAVTEHMKREAQTLIFDAVIGHQMVEATLEDEFKQSERDFQATYEAFLQSLRSEQSHESNQSDATVDATLDALFRGADVDEMLRLEVREELQQLQDDLTADLATYERDFHLLASHEDAAGSMEAARSKHGGWGSEDDEKYLAVLKNFERRSNGASVGQKKPELLYGQVKAVLPFKETVEIRKHAKFHTHLRFYQEKCRDRQKDHDRKFSELLAKAKEKIAFVRQQEEEKAKKIQQLQQMQQQCAQLHDKVAEWKTTKDAEQRIKEQQDELERMVAQQQKDAEDAKWRKRHEDQKMQVEDYRKTKLLGSLVDEMENEQLRLREEQEREALREVNAERVQYRHAEYERKIAEDRLEQQRREALEAERLAKLEAIKQETPYADRIAAIVADPERLRQETAAFRANVEAVDEDLPLNEKGLFPTHGYDCDTLFKNARFKLGIALRDAGLHSTDYARKALNNIKVSNAGAYRHAVAPSTQLW